MVHDLAAEPTTNDDDGMTMKHEAYAQSPRRVE